MPGGTRATCVSWPVYLDGLEEWLRRTEQGVLDASEHEPEPFRLVADGPLDPALALRTRALLDAVHRVEALAREQHARLQRAETYARH